METEKIAIGDIVSLKSHPYLLSINEILISGEPLQISPLMIIVEITEVKAQEDAFIYTCLWFSSKQNKFERTKIKSSFLKLIYKYDNPLMLDSLKAGDLLSLTTLDLELAKKKSSFHFEETSESQNNGSTTINSLLSFLPPLLHYMGSKEIQNKNGTVVSRNAKCIWFNNTLERFSEESIPLAALKLIPLVNENIIGKINEAVKEKNCLELNTNDGRILVKPKSLTSRSGYYFARCFDYVLNKNIEINIATIIGCKFLKTFYSCYAPKFDIENNSNANKIEFMNLEKKILIEEAKSNKSYVRIKYKNINDVLSIRSIKDYKLIELEGSNDEMYLIGFCMLRQSQRTFRVSRIQNLQVLNIQF